MLEWITNPEAWIALATLTSLERLTILFLYQY